MPNYDPKTGIHYGVIHQGKVLQAWADSSHPVYANDPVSMFSGLDDEPLYWEYDKEGYQAIMNEPPNIMLLKSPYYTWAKPCSPCYPNAGDLDTPTQAKIGFKTYCFGHDDWFDGPTPYLVYDVETGNLVPVPEYLKEVRK